MPTIPPSDVERLVAALDQIQPDWLSRFADPQSLREIADAAIRGKTDLAQRATREARYHTSFILMQVVRAALQAGIVGLLPD